MTLRTTKRRAASDAAKAALRTVAVAENVSSSSSPSQSRSDVSTAITSPDLPSGERAQFNAVDAEGEMEEVDNLDDSDDDGQDGSGEGTETQTKRKRPNAQAYRTRPDRREKNMLAQREYRKRKTAHARSLEQENKMLKDRVKALESGQMFGVPKRWDPLASPWPPTTAPYFLKRPAGSATRTTVQPMPSIPTDRMNMGMDLGTHGIVKLNGVPSSEPTSTYPPSPMLRFNAYSQPAQHPSRPFEGHVGHYGDVHPMNGSTEPKSLPSSFPSTDHFNQTNVNGHSHYIVDPRFHSVVTTASSCSNQLRCVPTSSGTGNSPSSSIGANTCDDFNGLTSTLSSATPSPMVETRPNTGAGPVFGDQLDYYSTSNSSSVGQVTSLWNDGFPGGNSQAVSGADASFQSPVKAPASYSLDVHPAQASDDLAAINALADASLHSSHQLSWPQAPPSDVFHSFVPPTSAPVAAGPLESCGNVSRLFVSYTQ